MIDIFVACGDGSAARCRVDLATYSEVYDHAAQPDCLGYLIRSGQLNATSIRIRTTEMFDAAHWFATGEHKSVGFAYEVSRS